MPTALIADDEPHLATYLQSALAASWPELQIVAVARNGVEAAERIAQLEPDLAFLGHQDARVDGAGGRPGHRRHDPRRLRDGLR